MTPSKELLLPRVIYGSLLVATIIALILTLILEPQECQRVVNAGKSQVKCHRWNVDDMHWVVCYSVLMSLAMNIWALIWTALTFRPKGAKLLAKSRLRLPGFTTAILAILFVTTFCFAPFHATFVESAVQEGKWIEGYSYGGVIPLCIAAVLSLLSTICSFYIAKLIRTSMPESNKSSQYCICCLCL